MKQYTVDSLLSARDLMVDFMFDLEKLRLLNYFETGMEYICKERMGYVWDRLLLCSSGTRSSIYVAEKKEATIFEDVCNALEVC